MDNQLYSPDEARKAAVRRDGTLNGIDYLEVLDDAAPPSSPPQQTLLLHCFLPVSGLDRRNVRIDGGVRVGPVGAVWAHPANAIPPELLSADEQAYFGDPAIVPDADRTLVVRTDSRGDFSTYTLRLILSPTQPNEPPADFDRVLNAVDFSFKVDCPSDFDCKTERDCPAPRLPAPQINYLAKDYASFRRLMLDRLAVTMPGWQERNAADVGIALVEVLAYAADHLSYYQDAVATEAYLGTARRRMSVRRHARLVDYFVHDGANARAWVSIEIAENSAADGATLAAGARLLSHNADLPTIVPPTQFRAVLATNPVVFETLHDIRLNNRRNAIPIYTWGETNACLPKGATKATLRGSAAELGLRAGDVLIFEEVRGAATGAIVDADPAHRHAVRISAPPVELVDKLTGDTVLNIVWHADDALPFPLCLREFEVDGAIVGASVARGNVVLADHGLLITDEPLRPAIVPADRRYRPLLARNNLTQQAPYNDERDRSRSATAALRPDVRAAVPAITLNGDGETWQPQRDLLNSDRFAAEFVAEVESDGRVQLRFGDGVLGRQPTVDAEFRATYRVGNGRAGNVGADAITSVITELDGIDRVRNPLPAEGGAEPEALDRVRLHAPEAFRTQERAVTPADYAAAAQRHPEVQRAAATRRWTGSWYTMFVTVDRVRGRAVDAAFEAELRAFLERFRLAGYDLEIDAPQFVPLDIAFAVCVKPGYERSSVKRALLDVFSSRDLPDGRRGFFHPDNFSFGQPVYLSQIVAAAMQVPGVEWIDTSESSLSQNRFGRWGQPARGELAAGMITFGRLEIARLDNDPSAPENGRIDFFVQGGL